MSTFIDGELPENAKIIEQLSKKAFEVESVDKSDDDSLFEIKVLPNRVPDAMSLEGMAQELCTVFDLKQKRAVHCLLFIFNLYNSYSS